jgi:hypothetical protein
VVAVSFVPNWVARTPAGHDINNNRRVISLKLIQ